VGDQDEDLAALMDFAVRRLTGLFYLSWNHLPRP
jgi:hypothetical protein